MAITHHGSNAVGNSANQATLTISMPASIAANDYGLAVVGVSNVTNPTMEDTGTWTKLMERTDSSSGTQTLAVYGKVLTGSESSFITYDTLGNNRAWQGGVVVYRGVDPADPLAAVTTGATAGGNSNEMVSANITPDVANSLIVVAYQINAGTTGASWTMDTGVTERVDVQTLSTIAKRPVALGDFAGPATANQAAGQKTATATISQATERYSITVALNPAIVVPANPTGLAIVGSGSSSD